MSVNGVVFKTTEARRFQDRPDGPMQIRIDHNSHLSVVSAEKDILRVDFQFTTSYGALGVVKLEGTLSMRHAEAEAAAAEYAKSRNLPPAVAQQVHGAILQASIPEAVGLAKGVRLPPPIPLPQVKIGGGTDAQAAAAAPADSPEIG